MKPVAVLLTLCYKAGGQLTWSRCPCSSADNLQKTYVSGEARVTALAGVSFDVEAGDFVALMGPSGCGKSTLLHLCGAMDRPTSGTLRLNDRDLVGDGRR